jgi:adenylate cyclase
MVLYNAPVFSIDHATRAVQSAIAMRRLIVEANRTRAHKLSVRIGLHSGEAVVGNIGTSILMNYTAIGDTVNTAKRLEEICEPDQILISSDTFALLKCEELDPRHVEMQPQGTKQLKGRSMGIEVFSVEDLTLSVQAIAIPAVEPVAEQAV